MTYSYMKRSRDGGTGVYMREGTTSRVIAADRPYGELCDFAASVRNMLATTSYVYARVKVKSVGSSVMLCKLLTPVQTVLQLICQQHEGNL
jgi:hypothetical protein